MTLPTAVPGKLRVICAGFSVPPMFIITEDTPEGQQNRTGYETAVAREVAKRLGLQVEFVPTDWSEFRPTLEAKDSTCDLILCGQAITAERAKYYNFAVPYGAFDECLLVPTNSPITSVSGLPEVSKKLGRKVKMAAIRDSTNAALGELWASRVGKEFVEVVPFDGATADVLGDMVASTESGETDGTIDDCIAFPKYLGPEAGGKYRVAFVEPTQQKWAMAFSLVKPSPKELVDAANKALNEMIADGWFASCWDEHFGKGNPDWERMFGKTPVPSCVSKA